MTAVGKILVVLNFLISGLLLYMVMTVYTTRTSWKTEYDKVRNLALVAEAAYKNEKQIHESDVKSRDSQLDSLGKNNQSLSGKLDAAVAANDKLQIDLDMAKASNTKETTTHTALKVEVDALKKERDDLTTDAQSRRAEVLAIQKELNDQKLLAVNYQIERDSQKQRAQRLLDRVEDLEKNITQLTNKLNALGASGGSSGGSLLTPQPLAAPRDVYGTVKAVSTNGLTVVNIGSDSGISSGNKLFIYRMDAQNPKNSLYLGELVISRVEPKQAVGQFYPKPFAKPDERLPKENDVVATSLGSR